MMAERSEDCLAVCGRIEPVVREHGDAHTRTMFHEFRGISRVATGDVDGGLAELREVYEGAMRSGYSRALGVFVNLGYWTWWAEGPEAGAQLFRDGAEFARRRGLSGDWAEAELTWALFDLGDWDDVLERTDRLVEAAQSSGIAVLEAMLRPTRGRISLARGDLEAARADASAAVALSEVADIPQATAPSLVLAAAVSATESDRAGALQHLAALDERTRGRARSRGIEAAEAARAALAVGETGPIERILAEPFPPIQRANAQHASATALCTEAGEDYESALAAHEAAAGLWKAFGHPLEAAHAHSGAARCAIALGRDASTHLDEARRGYERLGARLYLGGDETLGVPAAVSS
jgi:tetratricopeptide (TPR) repeat protein